MKRPNILFLMTDQQRFDTIAALGNKIIYTPNAIESLNSSLRKLVYHRGHFPSDEAAVKLLYLALRNLEKRWDRSIRDWTTALGQFSIFFQGRLPAA